MGNQVARIFTSPHAETHFGMGMNDFPGYAWHHLMTAGDVD
jgi:hypothetical protein